MDVLIAGGTGAIGSAIVRRFARDGHRVTFTWAHSAEEAHELAAELDVRSLHLDMLADWNPPDVHVDVLVNNVGVNLSGHGVDAVTDVELQTTFKVNVLGAVRLAQAYLPAMANRGFGRIVNINSLYGLTVPAHRLSYGVSKFAMRAVTSSLAQEFARHGVTVNDVCPGPVDSAMLRAMGQTAVDHGRSASLTAYLADVAREVPIGRLIAATEVAAATAWLASAESGACNGVALRVDGGALA